MYYLYINIVKVENEVKNLFKSHVLTDRRREHIKHLCGSGGIRTP